MTDAGWAERLARKHYGPNDSRIKLDPLARAYADGLKTERARAVRIVNRLVKRLLNVAYERYPVGYLAACEDVLNALQRGRGGKG